MGGRNQGLRLNKASIRGKLARPYLNKQAECGGSCQLSQLRGGIGRRVTVQGWLSQKTETYLGKKKKPKAKWAEGLAQVVQYLSSKVEALSSNSNTAPKNCERQKVRFKSSL
jgi:hypothetical protein